MVAKATLGKPGSWVGPRPKDWDALLAGDKDGSIKVSPKTRWPEGTWIECADGTQVWWNGSAWEKGKAKPAAVAPVIDHLEPEKHVEQDAFPLKVVGSNFTDDSTICFDGNKQITSHNPPTELTTQVKDSWIASTINVTVKDEKSGLESTSKTLTLTEKPKPKLPVIDHLGPNQVKEGEDREIHIYGYYLDQNGTLLVNGYKNNDLVTDRSSLPYAFKVRSSWTHGSSPYQIRWQNMDEKQSDPVPLYIDEGEHHHEPPPPPPAKLHVTRIDPSTVATLPDSIPASATIRFIVIGTGFSDNTVVEFQDEPNKNSWSRYTPEAIKSSTELSVKLPWRAAKGEYYLFLMDTSTKASSNNDNSIEFT